jgi:periplasmic divalent cation tolerance protein
MLIIIQTTVASEKDATKLAESLVEERLAACCQISSPITSIFRWEGKTQQNTEYVITAKTTQNMSEAAITHIRNNHPYSCPEIIQFQTDYVDPVYLNWARFSLSD